MDLINQLEEHKKLVSYLRFYSQSLEAYEQLREYRKGGKSGQDFSISEHSDKQSIALFSIANVEIAGKVTCLNRGEDSGTFPGADKVVTLNWIIEVD